MGFTIKSFSITSKLLDLVLACASTLPILLGLNLDMVLGEGQTIMYSSTYKLEFFQWQANMFCVQNWKGNHAFHTVSIAYRVGHFIHPKNKNLKWSTTISGSIPWFLPKTSTCKNKNIWKLWTLELSCTCRQGYNSVTILHMTLVGSHPITLDLCAAEIFVEEVEAKVEHVTFFK